MATLVSGRVFDAINILHDFETFPTLTVNWQEK